MMDGAQIRWANHACERLFGIPVEEAIGSPGLDFIHPDDLQLAVLALTSVQSKEVGTPLELRVRGAEGWKLVEMIGAPLGDDLVLSVRDLTERRRWEVAGDEIERFRSLMQNAASVTMLITQDGVVESSSGGLTRLLGLDQAWVEGQALGDLADDLDGPVVEAVIRDIQITEPDGTAAPVTVDVRLRHADGATVPFALTFTNLLDDPTAVGIVVADGAGRITSSNTRFAEMWCIPQSVLNARDDNQALAFVLEQLCDPEAFVAKIQELYDEPESESHDTLEFKDGRVFERDSLPQRIDGEVVGRVWSFRDVSEHRRLQNELAHQAFH